MTTNDPENSPRISDALSAIASAISIGLLIYARGDAIRNDTWTAMVALTAGGILVGAGVTIAAMLKPSIRHLPTLGIAIALLPSAFIVTTIFSARGSGTPVTSSNDARIGGQDYVATLHRNASARLATKQQIEDLCRSYVPPMRPYSRDFNCKSFAVDLGNFAEARGIRASIACITLQGVDEITAHAVVCFPTVDSTPIFIDTTPGPLFIGTASVREVLVQQNAAFRTLRNITFIQESSDGAISRQFDVPVGTGRTDTRVTAVEFF